MSVYIIYVLYVSVLFQGSRWHAFKWEMVDDTSCINGWAIYLSYLLRVFQGNILAWICGAVFTNRGCMCDSFSLYFTLLVFQRKRKILKKKGIRIATLLVSLILTRLMSDIYYNRNMISTNYVVLYFQIVYGSLLHLCISTVKTKIREVFS